MVPIDPRFQLVRMESVRMMVAKATAQDKGFAARWSSRLTYRSSCFPPALMETALAWQQVLSDHGQNTLIAPSDEEAPTRARDLPASPNLVNLRNDINTSKSQIARTVLARVGAATHKTRHQWSRAHVRRLHAAGCALGARGGGALF